MATTIQFETTFAIAILAIATGFASVVACGNRWRHDRGVRVRQGSASDAIWRSCSALGLGRLSLRPMPCERPSGDAKRAMRKAYRRGLA